MPTRDEVLGSLGKLLTDKSKLDRFAQAMDKQAELAKQLDLSFKQEDAQPEGETTVAEQESTLRKELETVLGVALEQVKALGDRLIVVESQLKALQGEATQAAQDTPNASLISFAQKYFQGASQPQGQAQHPSMPDPSGFQRPVENKGADQQGPFGMGIFNDIFAGKYDVPAKK
jgi:hypothetical protein